MRKIRLAAAAAAGVLVLTLSACADTSVEGTRADSPDAVDSTETTEQTTEQTEPAAEEPQAKDYSGPIGTTFQVEIEEGVTCTVTAADPKVLAANEFNKPENGQFLAVTVTATAKGGECSINPFEFEVRDAQGQTYTQGFAEGAGPELQARAIRDGEQAKGSITFDVPAARPLTFVWTPVTNFLSGRSAAEWTIS